MERGGLTIGGTRELPLGMEVPYVLIRVVVTQV